MAHRAILIERALATLEAIEKAVSENTSNVNPAQYQARVDNAVRIYCAENVADALSHLQRE